MSEQVHYNVDILMAEKMLAKVDNYSKSDAIQAIALTSIAESLIAIAKILKEKK
jgi:hypothetical protein